MMLIGLLLCSFAVSAFAGSVNQTNEDFIAETFTDNIPKSKVVWIKDDLRPAIANILGHEYAGLRIRYWQQVQRTAWILEEIGKESPITFGIIIAGGKVEQVKVLAYRESRGGEIQQRAFTRQYADAELNEQKLDRHIDGISGATLSVRAMTSVVTLALYLTQFINQTE
tara:strand:- start:2194 stop:2700 length:507 start_codon:yes stop_codon:yes gene_type:complete